jgi:hypothetical protein
VSARCAARLRACGRLLRARASRIGISRHFACSVPAAASAAVDGVDSAGGGGVFRAALSLRLPSQIAFHSHAGCPCMAVGLMLGGNAMPLA